MIATPDAGHFLAGRWIVGGIVFLAAATVLRGRRAVVSTPGHGSRPTRTARWPSTIATSRPRSTSRWAIKRKKNRSESAVTLLSVLSAERQASKGDNFRLCLSLKRRGRPDTARTVVHRNLKQQWSVALWAWGAWKNKKNIKYKIETRTDP